MLTYLQNQISYSKLMVIHSVQYEGHNAHHTNKCITIAKHYSSTSSRTWRTPEPPKWTRWWWRRWRTIEGTKEWTGWVWTMMKRTYKLSCTPSIKPQNLHEKKQSRKSYNGNVLSLPGRR